MYSHTALAVELTATSQTCTVRLSSFGTVHSKLYDPTGVMVAVQLESEFKV